MSCDPLPHDWKDKDTGQHAVHAAGLPVRYVKCTRCKQVGFRKPSTTLTGVSAVVYTWERGSWQAYS